MLSDTVSQAEIFPRCVEILAEELRPIHYIKLTDMALERMDIPREAVNFTRQCEDVREKLLEAERYGAGYTGRPHCFGFLRSWVRAQIQPQLLNKEKPICITATFPLSEDACFEALMRHPHLQNKTNAPLARIERSRARGYLIEAHVKDYFKCYFLDFYFPPDNEGLWRAFCNHDFKLNVIGKMWQVDIVGPSESGSYRPNGKMPVDIRVYARLEGNELTLEGFTFEKQLPQEIADDVFWWHQRPAQQLIVYLNCKKLGIDYSELTKSIREPAFGYGRLHPGRLL